MNFCLGTQFIGDPLPSRLLQSLACALSSECIRESSGLANLDHSVPLGGLRISAQHKHEGAASFARLVAASVFVTLAFSRPCQHLWVSAPGPESGLHAPFDQQQQVQVSGPRRREGKREHPSGSEKVLRYTSSFVISGIRWWFDSPGVCIRTPCPVPWWFSCSNLLMLLTGAHILSVLPVAVRERRSNQIELEFSFRLLQVLLMLDNEYYQWAELDRAKLFNTEFLKQTLPQASHTLLVATVQMTSCICFKYGELHQKIIKKKSVLQVIYHQMSKIFSWSGCPPLYLQVTRHRTTNKWH